MTITYPRLSDTIKTNPAFAAVYSYNQDDGFGNLIDTIDLCLMDKNKSSYIHAFLEREDLVIYNSTFYGSH